MGIVEKCAKFYPNSNFCRHWLYICPHKFYFSTVPTNESKRRSIIYYWGHLTSTTQSLCKYWSLIRSLASGFGTEQTCKKQLNKNCWNYFMHTITKKKLYYQTRWYMVRRVNAGFLVGLKCSKIWWIETYRVSGNKPSDGKINLCSMGHNRKYRRLFVQNALCIISCLYIGYSYESAFAEINEQLHTGIIFQRKKTVFPDNPKPWKLRTLEMFPDLVRVCTIRVLGK